MKYLADVTTLKYNHDKCTGCGRCQEVCPHGVFVVHKGKAEITDSDRCMECGACMNNCAFGAVVVSPGVGCAAAIINSLLYGGAPSCDCGGDDDSGGGSVCC